jgi:nucleoside-diphosphate-sugar epimerase
LYITFTTSSFFLLHCDAGAGEYPNMRMGWVHIDDVVTAHLLAFEVPSANGRYICSGEVAHFGDVLQILYNKYPKLKTSERYILLIKSFKLPQKQ